MALLAYNKTVLPLLLAASNTPVTLSASAMAGQRGSAWNVTSELVGLTGPQYVSLQAQVTAGDIDLEWTSDPEYTTPGLTIGGVDPGPHAATHLPGGLDAILTAVAGSIAVGDVAAIGVAASFAKSDHKHALAAPAAPASVNKSAAVAGVSANVAREDHKHDVATAVAGSVAIGDAATEGASASLARADHVHAVAAPAAPEDVDKTAADAGISADMARADHKHDISTAVSVDIAYANAEGISSSLARADHVHKAAPLENFSNGTRPAANTVAVGYAIWNTDDNKPNYSNGTNWYTSDGVLT